MGRTRIAVGGALLASGAIVAYAQVSIAKTLYVSASLGSNSHTGTSSAAPLATIQYAEGLTSPGDTVLVMNGTYVDQGTGGNILFVNRSGTAAAPITYKAYPGQQPVLRFTRSWAAIRVSADYIVLDGLQIVGNAATVQPSYALAQARNLLNPLTNGDGIDIDPPSAGVTPHHVTIQNMIIHDVPGGGIAVDDADYVTVQNNLVYNTSNWSPYGDSAISVYEPHDIDAATGYKISILRNTTFNNSELVPCVCRDYKAVSDGNGIIIDDNMDTQASGTRTPYHGRTLVAYNISFGNGGSGIHAYSSQHIDILNNTAYDNELTPTLDEGQIFSDTGSDVRIIDNILSSPAGKAITSRNNNTATVTEDYNILWNLAGPLLRPSVTGLHDILADPLFVKPSSGNFALLPSSPALKSGEPAALRNSAVPAAAGLVTSANRGAE